MERYSEDEFVTFKFTGQRRRCLNLASYNYLGMRSFFWCPRPCCTYTNEGTKRPILYVTIRTPTPTPTPTSDSSAGYAEPSGQCAQAVVRSVARSPLAFCSPMLEAGTCTIHRELEATVANFVGKEVLLSSSPCSVQSRVFVGCPLLRRQAALCLSMGFATNSTILPAIAPKGTLIISDALNHASIVIGARTAHAVIRVFRHNDFGHLEKLLRKAIAGGWSRYAAVLLWSHSRIPIPMPNQQQGNRGRICPGVGSSFASRESTG
jgi:hypothetical protein